jgi:hypothetical protein
VNKKHELAKLEAELASAIEATLPSFNIAAKTIHKLVEAQDDPEQAHFDRLLDLGYLVDCAGQLCGPNLHVLVRIMALLADGESDEACSTEEISSNEI